LFKEIQEISKDQYDQLSKDVQKFVSIEEAGHRFTYCCKRRGPVIRDSNLPNSEKRYLILMKLTEDTYISQTTVANQQKLFAFKKTLIRRRYECLRITCPPLTASYVPFRDYASKIKRMDEDALLKELDYTPH
ncbi:hypothetical protein ANCCAN_08319, partial [Ancylostoma caninum]